MFGIIVRRVSRASVGLIAAYALVLQVFLAYSVATQAAAQGSGTGSFFVICTDAGEAAVADGTGAPVKPSTHCPICTLAGPFAATLPEAVSLPVRPGVMLATTPFVSEAACLSHHEARAGLTRAPPRNA